MEHKRKSQRFCIVPELEDRFGNHVQIVAFNTVFNILCSQFFFSSRFKFKPKSISDVWAHILETKTKLYRS